jgi:hypothetical protein
MGFLRILFYGLLLLLLLLPWLYCGAAIAPMAASSVAASHVVGAPVDHVLSRVLQRLLHSQELLCDCCFHGGFRGGFRGCYSLGC